MSGHPALKHVTRFAYGDALAQEVRVDGEIPVYGSNGMTGFHDVANTECPAIIVGRKGSYGKITWAEEPGFCIDTAYYVDRRLTQANLRWLYWALQTLGLDQHSEDTGVPGLSREKAYQSKLRYPEPTEQERIANFLDDKTARIDALIAEKERLAIVLTELRAEAIDSAVLGTELLQRSKPLKGLEVLGTIPAGWAPSRMKFEIDYVTSGSRGWADFYTDEGALFVRIGNLTRDSLSLDLRDIQRVTLPDAVEGIRARVLPGDLLISITAYLGSIAVAPDDVDEAYVSQHVSLARPNHARALPEWLGYVVLSSVGRTFFELQAYGGTKVQLSLEDIRELPVPLPGMNVQAERLAHLKKRLIQISQLSAHAVEHIARLREYRSSLISAAVTGQLDTSNPEMAVA